MHTPEEGSIDIMVTNVEGKILLNEVLEGLGKGENLITLEMPVTEPGMYFLTVSHNGKYFSLEKIIIQ